VRSQCSLCLCGELSADKIYHRDTEDTEEAQRVNTDIDILN